MAAGSRLALLAALLGLAGAAAAQDRDGPDLGFLEYLGSWQESDEDWVVVAGTDDEALANAGEQAGEERGKDAKDGKSRGGKDREDARDGKDKEADAGDED